MTPPARARGTIALLEETCTTCDLCVRECPDDCIELEAHTETRVPAAGGRPRTVKVLDAFRVDFGLCMYCGICVEVCPFDALFWAPSPTPAAATRAGLVHGRDLLREALDRAPFPAPLDDPSAG